MRERDARRLDGEPAHRLDETERLLLRRGVARARRERRRPEPEVELALLLEPLPQPHGGELHPPVLGETPRELLGGLLRLQVRELRLLVGEQMSRLQLEQRRDQDEELAAGVEIELVALGEPLDEGNDDPGHVDLRRLDRVLEQEREQEVERPLEGIEVQLEVADGAGHDRTLAPGSDATLRHVHPRPLRRAGAARLARVAARAQNQTIPAMQTSPDTHVLTRRPRMWFAGSMRMSSIQKRPNE